MPTVFAIINLVSVYIMHEILVTGPSKLNARVAIMSDHMNTSAGVTLHVTYQSWDVGIYKAIITSDCSRSASFTYL